MRLRLVVVAWLLAVAPVPSAVAQAPLPRVHMVATGGTISNRDGGRLTAEELARSMPGLERAATLTHEQFLNVASSQITLEQWLQLARRVNELFAGDKELAGIVVTSGTDTLEETAFFLHLTVRDPRPVVVVGSMRNPSTLGYEGAANLLEGVRVAASPAARGKGVLVVLNDEINSARDVTKTDALRLQTFRSPTHGVLGIVDRDKVAIFRDLLQRHTHQSEFDVRTLTSLPRVDVVMVYQGASGDVIKALVDLGARGIVIAGAGAGAPSGTQGRGHRLRRREGRLRRDRDPHGRRTYRAQPRPGCGNADPGAAAPAGLQPLGRRSHPRQSAHPADAGAGDDQRPRRDSAHLQRVLIVAASLKSARRRSTKAHASSVHDRCRITPRSSGWHVGSAR